MILEPQSIIDEIRKRGMELVAAGDKVHFRPQSAMTPELLQLLKINKAGVLEILSNQNPGPHHPLADFDSSIFGDRGRWPGCCAAPAIVFRATARRAKETSIRTAHGFYRSVIKRPRLMTLSGRVI